MIKAKRTATIADAEVIDAISILVKPPLSVGALSGTVLTSVSLSARTFEGNGPARLLNEMLKTDSEAEGVRSAMFQDREIDERSKTSSDLN